MMERYSEMENVKTSFLDLSELLPDKQVSMRALLRRKVLFPRGFSSNFFAIAKYFNSTPLSLKPKKSSHLVNKYFITDIKLAIKVFGIKKSGDFLKDSRFPLELRKSVHSTVAGYLKTIIYNPTRHWFLMARTILSFVNSERLISGLLLSANYCQVVVGNGRLVNSAGAVLAARKQGISTLIVERGARPGMLDTYAFSAHSKIERQEQMMNLWNSFDPSSRIKSAEEYLEIRRVMDPISGIHWQRNMNPGSVPRFSKPNTFCFFTTTELEFAVFGDPIEPGSFETQVEAIIAVAESLNPIDWEVVVRRHPYSGKTPRVDPEAEIWNRLAGFSHVSIISPDSDVDSYALGNAATVVAHFDSSIGPELIYLNRTPVISMGPTFWEKENSPYAIRTKAQLSTMQLKSTPLRPISDVYPWALYMAKFGEPFKVVNWHQGKAFLAHHKLFSKGFKKHFRGELEAITDR